MFKTVRKSFSLESEEEGLSSYLSTQTFTHEPGCAPYETYPRQRQVCQIKEGILSSSSLVIPESVKGRPVKWALGYCYYYLTL